MNTTESQLLRQTLIAEAEKLPENYLREVLDFVRFLLSKGTRQTLQRQETALNPDNNPILKFIGGVSHGTLAQNIDEELYGTEDIR